MNIQITTQLLQDLGINLSDEDIKNLADHLESTLSQRVNDEIIDYLDEDQLSELAGLKQADEDTKWQWLTANVPELKEIIEDEIDILIGDLADKADSF